MSNLLLGLENVWATVVLTARSVAHNQILLGFALGFLASTLVHLFVMSDHPSRIAPILTSSPEESYKKVNPEDSNHILHKTFEHFKREYSRVRIVTLGALIVVVIAIGIAILRAY